MLKATLTLKNITPLFLSADSLDSPWLRAPSFKGLMRFWWRAARACSDTSVLREEESRLFGSADHGKSSVTLKTIPVDQPLQMKTDPKKDLNLKWWFDKKAKKLGGPHKGIGYLFFSVFTQNKPFWVPGTRFQLEVRANSLASIQKALASLWLLIYFGGVGSRSRRGGGCLCVECIEMPDEISGSLPQFMVPGPSGGPSGSALHILAFLRHNLATSLRLINNGHLPERFVTLYTNLSFLRVLVSIKPFSDWRTALNDVGSTYEEFRYAHKGDIFDSGAFGLPVRHKSEVLVPERGGTRRASPLILKILKIGYHYHWLAVRLTGEFLPEGGLLKFGNKKRRSDYRLLDEFWHTLRRHGKEKVLSMPLLLHSIIEKIREDLRPEKVILFGSRARGDASESADIDIAVEATQPVSSVDLVGPIDLVNLKKLSNSLLREKIQREGVILYERKA